MTKKNGSKKRDTKRRKIVCENLFSVFQLDTFADKSDDVHKNAKDGESAVEKKQDGGKLGVDVTNNAKDSGTAVEEKQDGKQLVYGALAGSVNHDIRFWYERETPETLWYKHSLEQILLCIFVTFIGNSDTNFRYTSQSFGLSSLRAPVVQTTVDHY